MSKHVVVKQELTGCLSDSDIKQQDVDFDVDEEINKETEEDEHVFTERSIMDLQNLMITRFMAVNELNRFSRSIGLH